MKLQIRKDRGIEIEHPQGKVLIDSEFYSNEYSEKNLYINSVPVQKDERFNFVTLAGEYEINDIFVIRRSNNSGYIIIIEDVCIYYLPKGVELVDYEKVSKNYSVDVFMFYLDNDSKSYPILEKAISKLDPIFVIPLVDSAGNPESIDIFFKEIGVEIGEAVNFVKISRTNSEESVINYIKMSF